MSPYKLAYDNCCNLIHNKCIQNGKPCRLSKHKRCRYFERYVLPITDTKIKSERLRKQRNLAKKAYLKQHKDYRELIEAYEV